MKILFIADIHIKLGQKNVPREWQKDRVMKLADTLNAALDGIDYMVIGGDLLDVANPSIEEIGLMYSFLSKLQCYGYIIPGNHELQTKTRDCFIHITDLLESTKFKVIREFTTIDEIDYIPYNILKSDWPTAQSNLAITHVRGRIPPHVEPEIDLDKYSSYSKVFAGDLHSRTNSQENILYPGSPFTTSFHRSRSSGANGYFIIDTYNQDHEWVELDLPQLIRKTITSQEEMVATEYDHTIYEIEGNLDELAGIQGNSLLSKKVTKDISTPSTLDMSGDIVEELATYLKEVRGIQDVPTYIDLYRSIIHD